MNTIWPSRRAARVLAARWALVVGLVAALLSIPTAAQAQSTTADSVSAALSSPSIETTLGTAAVTDTIYACYVASSGTVYRVNAAYAPSTCLKSTHYPFNWVKNNGLYRARKLMLTVRGYNASTKTLKCASNEIVTGGGYKILSLFQPRIFMILENGPGTYLNDLSGWTVSYTSDIPLDMQFYAICVPK